MEINEKSFNMTEMDTEEQPSLFNLQNILMTFALHWKWFILSVVICLLIGFVYWWNQPTTMAVRGKMRLIQQSQEKGNAVSAGLAVLSSLPLGIGNNLSASLGGAAEIDVEKEVIRSSDLVTEVVLDLGRLRPEDIGVEILFTSQDAKGELHIQEVQELDLVSFEGSIATYRTEVLPEHTGMYQVGKRIFPKNPRLPHRQDFPLVKWL